MPVSLEDANAFFEEKKNGTYKCVFCSKESFRVNTITDPADPKKVVVAMLEVPSAAEILAPTAHTHSFMSISCANCGTSTFLHMAQYYDWLINRKKEP